MIISDTSVEINFSNPVFAEPEKNKVSDELKKMYRPHLMEKNLEIHTNYDAHFISVQLILQNSDLSFFYPIQARCKWDHKRDLSRKDSALFLLDRISSYLSEYFIDSDTFLTIEWSSLSFDSRDYEMRGQVFNKKLESLADDFLKQHEVSH